MSMEDGVVTVDNKYDVDLMRGGSGSEKPTSYEVCRGVGNDDRDDERGMADTKYGKRPTPSTGKQTNENIMEDDIVSSSGVMKKPKMHRRPLFEESARLGKERGQCEKLIEEQGKK